MLILAGLQVYADAAAAYTAIEAHMRGSSNSGGFFFGSKPSSIDAAIFAHLAFQHGAPVSAPELTQKVPFLACGLSIKSMLTDRLFTLPCLELLFGQKVLRRSFWVLDSWRNIHSF